MAEIIKLKEEMDAREQAAFDALADRQELALIEAANALFHRERAKSAEQRMIAHEHFAACEEELFAAYEATEQWMNARKGN